jgi:hypothetical protein
MSKRFYDTTIWDKPWYRLLSPANKKAWDYINAKCDGVGVWTPDFEGASFFINEAPTWETLLSSCNDNIIVLPNGKWWLVYFCEFQYGPLSADIKNKPHASYLSLLAKHGLLKYFTLSPSGYKLDSIVYARGIDTLQEKEEETDKEKDTETETEESDELPEEARAMASLLATLHTAQIDAKYSPPEAQVEKWADDIDKLNRIDGRDWTDIERVIRWVKTPGQFWAPNIMSGKKLRDKFAQIWPQIVAIPKRGGPQYETGANPYKREYSLGEK